MLPRSLLPPALLAAALVPGAGQSDAAHRVELVPAVTAAELEAHVRLLADDGLSGRETATAGTRLAAEYLAEVLALAGVRPAGGGGTYYQVVPLERETPVRPATVGLLLADGSRSELVDGLGLLVRSRGATTAELEVLAFDAPEDVPPVARADAAVWIDADRTTALEWLAAAGHEDGRGFGLVVVPGRSTEGRRERTASGRGSLRLVRPGPRPPAVVRVNGPALEAFRAGGVLSARFDAGTEVEALRCQNVVGILPGRRADELVVLSAHYDHVGRRAAPEPDPDADPEPEDGTGEDEDRIYNGADDDASGCAAVLEIAAALAAGPTPERGVVVLLATGEERGLLGTEHYLANPVVPLDHTVANLNFEMVGRPDDLVGAGRLWLTGWERSNLGAGLRSAAIPIAPDERPDQDFFRRSDNYAFARLGIVAQTLSSYGLHDDYHRPSDEWQTLDYEHMESAVRSGLEAVRLVVSGELDPAWLPGGNPAEQ